MLPLLTPLLAAAMALTVVMSLALTVVLRTMGVGVYSGTLALLRVLLVLLLQRLARLLQLLPPQQLYQLHWKKGRPFGLDLLQARHGTRF